MKLAIAEKLSLYHFMIEPCPWHNKERTKLWLDLDVLLFAVKMPANMNPFLSVTKFCTLKSTYYALLNKR